MTMNLYEVFLETARRQPAHPAILGPGPEDALSYAALAEAIDAMNAALVRAGLRAGDCLGLHVPSGADYIVLTYAAWRCGACVVPLPIELTVPEKQEILETIALDVVVTSKTATS